MKVAIVRHLLDQPQGGARQVALLARDLQSLGADVGVYCYALDPNGCFPEILGSVPVKSVRRADPGQGDEGGLIRTVRQLRRYFREASQVAEIIPPDIDVINPHEWLAHRSAIRFRARSVPVVWSYNDPSAWHAGSGAWWRNVPTRLLGWYDTRQINRRVAVITTLDRRMQGIAQREFTVPVRIVRSGVDHRTTEPRPHPRIRQPSGQLRLLSVGVLFPHRRLEDAIQAVHLARRNGYHCTYEIIGSPRYWPSYAAELTGLVGQLALDRHVRLRFESISERELQDAYGRSDVLVFPNAPQTWGLAPLEAMAHGIPAIVSRGAGVHEVLTDGETGVLVDPGRPDQLCAALERLANDPLFRERLAAAGQRLVRGSFSSMEYAKQMLDLFADLVVHPRVS